MEPLREYLNSLSPAEQAAFAERSGTTAGYLRKAICRGQRLGLELVIALERESGGRVPREAVRPDFDWTSLGRRSRRVRATA